jgi:hypothetical protein
MMIYDPHEIMLNNRRPVTALQTSRRLRLYRSRRTESPQEIPQDRLGRLQARCEHGTSCREAVRVQGEPFVSDFLWYRKHAKPGLFS